MITEYDLAEAIAECEGQRNPSISTCMKLASLYIIKDKKFPDEREMTHMSEIPMMSFSNGDEKMDEKIRYEKNNTEFLQAIDGMNTNDVIKIMDELMSTVKTLIPKLYDGVMRKLSE